VGGKVNRIDQIIKVTRGKDEFLGKEKIAVYLEKRSMDKLRKWASRNRIPLYREIIGLMNDGVKWRRENGNTGY
jgi:hypothetical protein